MEALLKKHEIIDSYYKVLFFISGDAFNEKYRVKGKDGKSYLLKLYNSSKLTKNDFSGNNLLEIEILSSLSSSGIDKIIGNGEFVKNNQKYHYIVFNFVSGETLKEKIQRAGLFSQYAAIPIINYLLEIVAGIHNHTNPVIHNNINLNSVYLDYSNAEKPVLTDFEFARYITSKRNSLNLISLSPFYIAPELYNGIFTIQSDIFSVGALLYHLTMGVPPWYLEIPKYQHTKESFIDAINSKRMESLDFEINETQGLNDEHLITVIKKALAINIDERFKNADEFKSALQDGTVISFDEAKKGHQTKTIRKKMSGFSAIAGMQELKNILYNDVIRALNEKELYQSYGITIPNGMLLYGPPGCGKTFISEKFAEEVGFNFIQLKPSDIKSKYINATEENISKIFKLAYEKAPTIIFIDEIDALVPNREGNTHQMHSAPVNEFLSQMSNSSEKGIFVIATSNRPEKIDPSVLRTGRIDKIIYISPPDFDARKSMFKLYLKKRPIDLGLDYSKLADMTENYVSSDIKYIIDEASREALKSQSRITQNMFNQVLSDYEPSISLNELEKYKILKERMENKNQNSKKSNKRIGFV